MILSMTGFGSSRAETPNVSVSVEAKTVNHRYLDLHVRLPSEFQSLEPVVRKVASSRLKRGRVDIFIKIERTQSDVRIDSDPDLIGAYVDLVKDLQARFPIAGELTVEAVTKIPGAIQVLGREPSKDEQDALIACVERATLDAVDQVRDMRAREGEALVADLKGRLDSIRRNLRTISECATALLEHYRTLLTERVAVLAPNLDVDSNRLEVEALIHAEKSDIAEEITRLDSHLDQFGGTLDKDAEAGKRLDFLLQEMNREVSTILSKTSGLNQTGASIGESGIDIKVEIDKLREQVQNIE
jgi:uncharacterized protein (TIGR00255 family)